MKPTKIFDIMDLSRKAKSNGDRFNPLFVGPPGVGKSEIVQQWCKANNLPFIDIRAAYLEAPDLIGFPSIENKNGRQVTVHNTPDFFPSDPDWEGVFLLEEPNRGTTSVMNTFMQMLTDGKVHNYTFPKKAIFVGCINPDGSNYDVNTMDSALRNRFVTFNVDYDKNCFVDFMKEHNWDKSISNFVEAGFFKFVTPEEIGDNPGSKYVSPRTLAQLNAALKAGLSSEDELMVYESVVGTSIAKAFYKFKHDESPVMYKDLLNNTKASLKKLEGFCDNAKLQSGMISLTLNDILEVNEITDTLLTQVVSVLPVDQAAGLIRDLEFKRKDDGLLLRICNEDKKIKEKFKTVLKYGKAS